ncbi:hypothetical protein ACFE04_024192 [Oxalis oulophora]
MGAMSSSTSAAAIPHQPFGWVVGPNSPSQVGPTSLHLITTASYLHLVHHLNHHRFKFIIHSFFKTYLFGRLSVIYNEVLAAGRCMQVLNFSHNLCNLPKLEDVWHERFHFMEQFNFLQLSNGSLPFDFASTPLSSFGGFFNGGKSFKESESGFSKRRWTNILLAVNILVYIAQVSTNGKLLLWGAKINCYSLNSIGPSVENICGPKRYLAVYFSSAVTSSLASYWFCKAPAVGASGAIFGLVGCFGVFIMRHRSLIKGGGEDLQHIAKVIFLNMAIGLMSKGIDNWGHFGGLLGGCATSWLLGPAWKFEALSSDRRKIFVDRAPINYLLNRNNTGPKKLN